MKKITKFENYMGQLISTTDLINYEQQSSSSINYNSNTFSFMDNALNPNQPNFFINTNSQSVN